MHILSTLIIYLLPLLPAELPANQIYMGQGIEPITAIKVKRGWLAPTLSMVLTPYEWIRLKSALEGSPDLCTFAINEAIDTCLQGQKREQTIMLNREISDAQLITAYESRLKIIESELQSSYKQNKILMYISAGVGVIATAATTMAILK